MACCGAREISDNDIVIVGTGFPTMSANIAKETHAPNVILMQESGVIDAQPERPALSVGDPCLNPGAAMIGGLLEIMGMCLQAGRVDLGFLSGSQVDKFGNINTTVIGDYHKPKSRLPGSGGANPIGSLVKRTLIITRDWPPYTCQWLSSVTAQDPAVSDLRHDHIRVRVLSGPAIQTVLYLKIRFTIPKDT